MNDAGLGPVIEKAFSKGKPAAVALEINSPGGSPVQSSLIGARIRRLAEEKDIPVIAFVEDVAASAGIGWPAAADEIFADDSSIVGSIGVISAGFGAHELLGQTGVERGFTRQATPNPCWTRSSRKNPEDVARLKGLLEDLHGNFIDKSKRGAATSSTSKRTCSTEKSGWHASALSWG